MEKLIEVLKNKFSDIYIYTGYGGLICKFNKDKMTMSIFKITCDITDEMTFSIFMMTGETKWIIRYAPTELFDKQNIADSHIEVFGDIQGVIDWLSDDKNIIKIYEESLQDLSEYNLQHHVFFPPCQDCNAKMDEIRRSYDKLKNQESSDEDMIDKIKADIANNLQIMDICDVKKVNGIIIQSELANRKVVSYDSVMQILDKYKSGGEDKE